MSITGQPASYPFSLASGANTTFTVQFTPTATGDISGSLSIPSDATNQPTVVSLSGTGTTAILSASPTTLAFGNVMVGNNASLSTTVTNSGTLNVTLGTPAITGTGYTITAQPSSGTVLTPNASATYTVQFAPSAAGVVPGTLTINSNATGTALNIALFGEGNETIWPSTATPATLDSGDGNSYELGVKFQATTTGTVTGVRFYKAAANTGTHIGDLWTSTGTLLATGTFTGETSSGWQQLNFSSGVAISANTMYVVSYHTNTGHFSFDAHYFSTSGHTNTSGTLTALVSSGGSTGNGVFIQSGSSAFPTTSFNDNNYWVDVVFAPNLPSSIGASPQSLDFGGQLINTSNTLSTTVTNTGTSSVTISGATATGAYTITSPSNTVYPLTLAPNATHSYTVQFTPTLTGAASGNLAIASNATVNPLNVPLSGTGEPILETLSSAPASLSFGEVVVNSAGSLSVTVTNTGNLTFSLTSDSITGPGFTITSRPTYPASLAPNASVVYTVQFAPTTLGSLSGALTINSNSPASPLTVGLSGTSEVMSIWPGSTTPVTVDSGDGSAIEVGVKFTASVNGMATGVRFYKSSANTGTHVGSVWDPSVSTTVPIATGTFTGETATGWQELDFPAGSGMTISHGNTYIVSYHTTTGHYAFDQNYFTDANAPAYTHVVPSLGTLAAVKNSVSANGVFTSGSGAPLFPSSTFNATNYYADLVFVPALPNSIAAIPASLAFGDVVVNSSSSMTLILKNTGTVSVTINSSSITGAGYSITSQPANGTVLAPDATASYAIQFAPVQTVTSPGTLQINSTATGSPLNVALSGNGSPISIWLSSEKPTTIDSGDGTANELGVKFTASTSGTITGIRFYKSPANVGTHIGNLWSSSGTLLATGTFTNETASGWQQMNFNSFASITSGTTYIASYHTNAGHYSFDKSYFASSGHTNPSGTLTALLSTGGSTGNGVFVGGASAFPSTSFQDSNYWVDLMFTPTAAMQVLPNPSNLNFGVVITNTTASLSTQIVNTGTSTVTLGSASVTGTGMSITSQPSSGTTLAPGASATYTIQFAPGTFTGNVTGALTVLSNATNSPAIVSLSATAAAPVKALTVSPANLDFGSQVWIDTISPQVTTVTNTGNVNVTLGTATITGTGMSIASDPSSGTALAPNASATYTVQFAPTATGESTGDLTINSDATNSPAVVSLQGASISQPVAGAPVLFFTDLDSGPNVGGETVGNFAGSYVTFMELSLAPRKVPRRSPGMA